MVPRHLFGRLTLIIGEELQEPAIQLGHLFGIGIARIVFYQMIDTLLFDDTLPELLVDLAPGGFHKLLEDNHKIVRPLFKTVFPQAACLVEHLLPVVGCTCERDGGDATGGCDIGIDEIFLDDIHQRDLRGDAFGEARSGEISRHQVGQLTFGIPGDGGGEVVQQELPTASGHEDIIVGVDHEFHLILMRHKQVAHLLRMGIHIAGEALTDDEPHHVGRQHQRTMIGVGLHHALEEVVIAQVAQALAFETGLLHLVELLGYARDVDNLFGNLLTVELLEGRLGGGQVLVNLNDCAHDIQSSAWALKRVFNPGEGQLLDIFH